MPSRIPFVKPPLLGDDSIRRRMRNEGRRFYGRKAWIQLREIKLSSSPYCEECERAGRLTVAVEVHHVKPRKERPDLELDLGNLMSLCTPCHTSIENRQRKIK